MDHAQCKCHVYLYYSVERRSRLCYQLTRHSVSLADVRDHTLICKVLVQSLCRGTYRENVWPNLGLVRSVMGLVQQLRRLLGPLGSRTALMYLYMWFRESARFSIFALLQYQQNRSQKNCVADSIWYYLSLFRVSSMLEK